jgi:hypothetical protein
MNKTIASLATAVVVTAGSVTGLVALSGTADAATTWHTLKIRVTGLGEGHETRSGFVSESKVTTLDGKFLGYEVDSGSFGPDGITDRIAIALDGGILYCRTTVTETSEKGKVTGGSGKFAGAKGSIVSTSHDEQAQTATYTITWHK